MQKANEKKASLFSSLVIGLAFSASFIGAVGAQITGNNSLANMVQAMAMLLLLAFSQFKPKRFGYEKYAANQLMPLLAILLFASVMSVYMYGGGASQFLRRGILFKTLGLNLIVISLLASLRVFSASEIRKGLLIYCVLEISMILAAFLALRLDFNNNNLGGRAAVAGLVFFASSKNRPIGISALCGCLFLAFTLNCRTSVVASVGALSVLFLEQHTRRYRELAIVGVLVGLGVIYFLLPYLYEAFLATITRFLGSSNLIAQFFLSDKTSSSLSTNILDRQQVWEYAFEKISQRPLTGYGLGTEQAVMGARSHNAFLSLIFEAGIFYLALWLAFYFPFLLKIKNHRWTNRLEQYQLNCCALLLFSYMFLAGLVESSGLSSISTPVNVIFMFLAIYTSVKQPRRSDTTANQQYPNYQR